ncbi:MAG: serine hydrolase [Planctomycetota bacterium]|nr:serine hydrolase [Planctomycetota bacterium]
MRVFLLSFLVLVAALAADAKSKKRPLAGTWSLELERPARWDPRICKGTLILERDGRKWGGRIRFQRILYARNVPLADLQIRGTQVKFRLDHPDFDIRFDGKLAKGSLSGKCRWRGSGVFPWRAVKEEIDRSKVDRFEKGLTFDGFFPRADPEQVGLDRAALDALIRAAGKVDTDALLLLKDGKVICERYFGGKPQSIHIMSVTKFLTAMAAARLLDEKKISSLDAPVSTWFPEWRKGLKGKVTLRHLLTHTSGLEYRPKAHVLNDQKDRVAFVRRNKIVVEPGTRWKYSNEGVALLSGIFGEATGMPVDAYLKGKLFDPMGLRDWAWNRDDAGQTVTYAELSLRPRDLARIGQLVVQGGKWDGESLFPAKWIETLSTPTKIEKTCGLLWRIAYDRNKQVGVYHTGSLGQFLAIYPEWNLVGVRLRRWKKETADRVEYEFGGFMSLLQAAVVR